MQTRLMFVHALSPLHAGTGQSIGAVDLPIARDRATDHPYLPGSSLKGSLRDRCRELAADRVVSVFGPETANASDHAGAMAFGDANLLLMPVRSVSGTFAWATSPLLLSRFRRDAREAGLTLPPSAAPPTSFCAVSENSVLPLNVGNRSKVVFEDLDLDVSPDPGVSALAEALGGWLFPGEPDWQKMLRSRLCIVSDDILSFLARHGTDVVTRIRLDEESKTVAKGALWTEENLPSESVLVSMVAAMPNARTRLSNAQLFATLAELTQGSVQLGGKATVGRGRCRLVLAGGVQ